MLLFLVVRNSQRVSNPLFHGVLFAVFACVEASLLRIDKHTLLPKVQTKQTTHTHTHTRARAHDTHRHTHTHTHTHTHREGEEKTHVLR